MNATLVAFDDEGVEVSVRPQTCGGCEKEIGRFYLTLETTVGEGGDIDFTVQKESVACCGHVASDEMPVTIFAQLLEHLTTCPGHTSQRREKRPRT